MSNIAIKGATTGTGTFTIESPATNTDRTLTLPDEAGTLATVNGITHIDQWRLTSDWSTSNAVIASGWTRSNEPLHASLGTGVTESSGIFTFPTTGIWAVHVFVRVQASADDNIVVYLRGTTDNSTYEQISELWSNAGSATNNTTMSTSSLDLLNITDTANQKIQLYASSLEATSYIDSTINSDSTGIKFIRVGDAQ